MARKKGGDHRPGGKATHTEGKRSSSEPASDDRRAVAASEAPQGSSRGASRSQQLRTRSSRDKPPHVTRGTGEPESEH